MKLHLSLDLALPLELVTESLGILAIKRAGKSYTARKPDMVRRPTPDQVHEIGERLPGPDHSGDDDGALLRGRRDGQRPGVHAMSDKRISAMVIPTKSRNNPALETRAQMTSAGGQVVDDYRFTEEEQDFIIEALRPFLQGPHHDFVDGILTKIDMLRCLDEE